MSLADESKAANWCNTFYAETRDEVLRAHPWNFANKRTVLSRLVAAPVFGWAYQYQLPEDCLRVLQLNACKYWYNDITWEIEGRVLLTDDIEARLKYVCRVADANLFDSIFVEALSIKLASKLAKPIYGSDTVGGNLLAEYARVTGPLAQGVDAREKKSRLRSPREGSRFVQARGAYYI